MCGWNSRNDATSTPTNLILKKKTNKQGEDIRYTLRHRLLAASADAALRLISPICLSAGPLGALRLVVCIYIYI